jgi:hydroxyacyl-ACP dehydratase HTD2-like protein with hotdog domain
MKLNIKVKILFKKKVKKKKKKKKNFEQTDLPLFSFSPLLSNRLDIHYTVST